MDERNSKAKKVVNDKKSRTDKNSEHSSSKLNKKQHERRRSSDSESLASVHENSQSPGPSSAKTRTPSMISSPEKSEFNSLTTIINSNSAPEPESMQDLKTGCGRDANQNSKLISKSVFEIAGTKLIPFNYLQQGLQATATRDRRIRILLDERKWQKNGWDDLSIELFIQQLATMDSNNFETKIGVGEREARIYSGLVEKRHFRLCHGVGRSGDLAEAQPKAIGSSLMANLVNALVLDVCKTLISPKVASAFLCPMATGMSLSLVLLTLRREKPKAKYVIWPRIDQKSCFKAILTSGLEPLVIEGKHDEKNQEVRTNMEELKTVLRVYGTEHILCILTTTSCFAPRVSDSLTLVSKFCQEENIFHVVNNAYGLQNSGCVHQILEGSEVGRLDVFVQSTDKNLMVPVGGAIIAGFNKDLIQKIRQTYPGRASSSQTLDVLITLLSMGSATYNFLVMKTKENYIYLKQTMEEFAKRYKENVIQTPHNRISIAMTLKNIAPKLEPPESRSKILTELGSMLFRRHVGGCRVVTGIETKMVDGHTFRGWGAHCKNYPVPYMTAAATIGMERKEVDAFIKKLEECYKKLETTFQSQENDLNYNFDNLDGED